MSADLKLQRLRCICLAPIVAFRASAPGAGSVKDIVAYENGSRS